MPSKRSFRENLHLCRVQQLARRRCWGAEVGYLSRDGGMFKCKADMMKSYDIDKG